MSPRPGQTYGDDRGGAVLTIDEVTRDAVIVTATFVATKAKTTHAFTKAGWYRILDGGRLTMLEPEPMLV
jgi:hypothetical protein